MFDRTIDAIEEAVQDSGYTFDRALMPWDKKIHPETNDYESRLEAEKYQQGREELPGINQRCRHSTTDTPVADI
jgi:uncharacterized protein YjbK